MSPCASRNLPPSLAGPSKGSANWESERGCSDVSDAVEISDIIEEVSQADSSADHEEERVGEGSAWGGCESVRGCVEIWVGVGDRELDWF